jgi:hypothetical protein
MPKKQRKREILRWKKEKPKLDAARAKLTTPLHITAEELPAYHQALDEARAKHNLPTAPMATVAEGNLERKHQDHIAEAGFASNDWFAMVHTPVPMKKALTTPKARSS